MNCYDKCGQSFPIEKQIEDILAGGPYPTFKYASVTKYTKSKDANLK